MTPDIASGLFMLGWSLREAAGRGSAEEEVN